MKPGPEPADRRWQPLLRRADQGCLALVVALSLAALAGYALYQWKIGSGWIDIERAEQLPLTFEVDVNRAEWTELTLLPGVGESMAKGIVESRESNGPFRRHEDLRRVRGIGPKTLDKIKPYLSPIDEPPNVAER